MCDACLHYPSGFQVRTEPMRADNLMLQQPTGGDMRIEISKMELLNGKLILTGDITSGVGDPPLPHPDPMPQPDPGPTVPPEQPGAGLTGKYETYLDEKPKAADYLPRSRSYKRTIRDAMSGDRFQYWVVMPGSGNPMLPPSFKEDELLGV